RSFLNDGKEADLSIFLSLHTSPGPVYLMRNVSPAKILLLFLILYAFIIYLQRFPADFALSGARYVIHNGFCVRPYFHVGKNATVRLLSMPTEENEVQVE
ncbi:hypothetical protein PMAYCL1PPCAC_14857, partial [Pristionchus mayeri]